MKADDPNIKWVDEPKLGLAGRMYLPLIFGGLTTTSQAFGQSQGDGQLSGTGTGTGQSADLSRRASTESRRAGTREVRGLFSLCHGLSGSLHRHRRRREPVAGSREVSRELYDRRTALHLLRHVRRGVSGRRHRIDQPLQPDRSQSRRDGVRQGETAERLRRDQGQGADEVAQAGRHAYESRLRHCCWPVIEWSLPGSWRWLAAAGPHGSFRWACRCPAGCRTEPAAGRWRC